MKLAVEVARQRRVRNTLLIALGVVAIIPTLGAVFGKPSEEVDQSVLGADRRFAITAPGRIEPKDGLRTIAAPASAETGPAIVTELNVQEGEQVERGAVLAILRGRTELEAAVVAAQRRVALAHARLEAVKAGGKADDLRALEAEIRSDEATLALAQSQTRRTEQLKGAGLVATEAVEMQSARLAAAVSALDAKRARLRALSSVRPADLAVAAAEVQAAESEMQEAVARLESTVVRAPESGVVIAIYARPGQIVGADGLLAFGQTQQMFVDAEVLEEDLPRARLGQKVQITGHMLAEPVSGTVEQIGSLVGTREVFHNDPTAFTDSRVAHVKIRADNPTALARFIHGRVTVVIQQ